MLLQPIIENSIKHGLARKVGGGRITIRTSRRENRSFIEVQDDWVPCRFREPELLPARSRANPYSGKWNFFCGDHSTPMAEKLRILESALRDICSETTASR